MRQQPEPDSRILICLGPCHGEFYYPLAKNERISCPTDRSHPVALYNLALVTDPEPDEEDDE